jgi:hypothetical protein
MVLGSLELASATVDDAHSYAMEAAVPFVGKGFVVRSDYWKGEVASGEKKAVRHQLFKGNEYCFWLACDVPGATLTIGVFDSDGNAVEIEVLPGNHSKSVRILPPRTGTYVVAFSIGLPGGDEAAEVDGDAGRARWALAYGYR